MHHPARHPALHRRCRAAVAGRALRAAAAAVALSAAVLAAGCQQQAAPRAQPLIKYSELGKKENVPPFMEGTIWQLTERTNDEPYVSATYGLVGRLRGTGDSTASLPVRQWMHKQMVRHGYGSKLQPGFEQVGAEQVLRDPGYAIVRVDGLIPPGAREGDFFDVTVSALPGNKTTSLSGGLLFQSDLHRVRGRTPDLDGVEVLAQARGPIVVNPAYALNDPAEEKSGQVKASLRSGVVMDGGRVLHDRAVLLRLRHPERKIARLIENRINQRFQKEADYPRKNVMPVSYQAAAALDEGIVEVYVPKSFRGDWEHFIGVVEQLYLNISPAFTVAKAKELTEAALKPDAPLLEISYALEGLGQPALQYTLPLMALPNPDVAFAMARASACIGDNTGAAQAVLLRIAASDDNPFQLAAIQTLASLPSSPERNQKIRDLLESKNSLARTAVYKMLVRNGDPSIYTRWVQDPRDLRPADERDEKFALDVVPAGGEPVIFASRSGIPRIGLIGPKPQLKLPIVFTAMGGQLMISSRDVGRTVTIFYRDDVRGEPIKMVSRPDLAEVIARLGGEGAPSEEKFDFTYGEVVAVVQELSNQKKITGAGEDGRIQLASFIFEQPRESQDLIETAPVIEDSRPNTAGGAARAPGEASPSVAVSGRQPSPQQ